MDGSTNRSQRKTIDLLSIGSNFILSVDAPPVNAPRHELRHVDGAGGVGGVRCGGGDVGVPAVDLTRLALTLAGEDGLLQALLAGHEVTVATLVR